MSNQDSLESKIKNQKSKIKNQKSKILEKYLATNYYRPTSIQMEMRLRKIIIAQDGNIST